MMEVNKWVLLAGVFLGGCAVDQVGAGEEGDEAVVDEEESPALSESGWGCTTTPLTLGVNSTATQVRGRANYSCSKYGAARTICVAVAWSTGSSGETAKNVGTGASSGTAYSSWVSASGQVAYKSCSQIVYSAGSCDTNKYQHSAGVCK